MRAGGREPRIRNFTVGFQLSRDRDSVQNAKVMNSRNSKMDEELARGKELARMVVEHLLSMEGAASASIPVCVQGEAYKVTFSAERITSHAHVAQDGTNRCGACGFDICDPVHRSARLIQRVAERPHDA